MTEKKYDSSHKVLTVPGVKIWETGSSDSPFLKIHLNDGETNTNVSIQTSDYRHLPVITIEEIPTSSESIKKTLREFNQITFSFGPNFCLTTTLKDGSQNVSRGGLSTVDNSTLSLLGNLVKILQSNPEGNYQPSIAALNKLIDQINSAK